MNFSEKNIHKSSLEHVEIAATLTSVLMLTEFDYLVSNTVLSSISVFKVFPTSYITSKSVPAIFRLLVLMGKR